MYHGYLEWAYRYVCFLLVYRPGRLQAVKQTRALEHENDLVDDGADGLLLAIDNEIGLGGSLVRVIYTGEALDLTLAGSCVNTLLVRLLAVLQRSGNVHEVEVTVLLDGLFRSSTVDLEGGNRSRNDGGAGPCQLASDKGNAGNVLAAVLSAETQLRRQLGPNGLTEQHRDGSAALLVECDL